MSYGKRGDQYRRRHPFVWGLLRLSLGVSIIAWLLFRINIDNLREALRAVSGSRSWLGLGLVLICMGLLACMARWKMLLDSQQVRLSSKDVFLIFFSGNFFNIFMLGATGGDLVKASLAARGAGGRKTEAVATVLIDRCIGFAVLALLAGVLVTVRAGFFFGNRTLRPVGGLVLAVLALTVLLVEGLFRGKWLQYPQAAARRLLPAESSRRIEQTLRRCRDACLICRRQRGLLLKACSLSLVNHMTSVMACAVFGYILRLQIAWTEYLTFIPLIVLAGMLPVTVGGLGIREGAAVLLLTAVNATQEEALLLSLLFYFCLLFWSLFGGILFVLFIASPGSFARGPGTGPLRAARRFSRR